MQGLALPTSAPPPLPLSMTHQIPAPLLTGFQFLRCTRFFFPSQSLPTYSFPFVSSVQNAALNPLSDPLQRHLAFRCHFSGISLTVTSSAFYYSRSPSHPKVTFIVLWIFPQGNSHNFCYMFICASLFSVCLSKQMLLAISMLKDKLRYIRFLNSLLEQLLI